MVIIFTVEFCMSHKDNSHRFASGDRPIYSAERWQSAIEWIFDARDNATTNSHHPKKKAQVKSFRHRWALRNFASGFFFLTRVNNKFTTKYSYINCIVMRTRLHDRVEKRYINDAECDRTFFVAWVHELRFWSERKAFCFILFWSFKHTEDIERTGIIHSIIRRSVWSGKRNEYSLHMQWIKFMQSKIQLQSRIEWNLNRRFVRKVHKINSNEVRDIHISCELSSNYCFSLRRHKRNLFCFVSKAHSVIPAHRCTEDGWRQWLCNWETAANKWWCSVAYQFDQIKMNDSISDCNLQPHFNWTKTKSKCQNAIEK